MCTHKHNIALVDQGALSLPLDVMNLCVLLADSLNTSTHAITAMTLHYWTKEAVGLPLEVCLRVYDDILHLSGIALEKLMKQWLKAYYLFLNMYIDYCVLGKNFHA